MQYALEKTIFNTLRILSWSLELLDKRTRCNEIYLNESPKKEIIVCFSSRWSTGSGYFLKLSFLSSHYGGFSSQIANFRRLGGRLISKIALTTRTSDVKLS